jgi:thermosome
MMQATMGWSQRILNAGSERTNGADVRAGNVAAGRALAETVRTTLGPRGMDKMLVSSGKIVITNDGASILDRMAIEHPAADIVAEVAEHQKTEVGDGTTTAVLLAGQLLAEAERLLEQRVHPTSITGGYQLAVSRALEALASQAIAVDAADRAQLLNIAKTSVTGKWDEQATEALAGLAVDAVLAVADAGTVLHDNLTVQTVIGGSALDSELIDGLVIDMERSSTSLEMFDTALPRRIENAGIALIDDPLTIERTSGRSRVTMDSTETRRAFLDYEDGIYADTVAALVHVGADVVFCQKSIDAPLRHLLAREGILALERTRQDEMYKLARAAGGHLVMSTDELTPADIGRAGLVERRTVAGTDLTLVRDCADSRQYSFLLRGGSAHVVAETKRVVESCVQVVALAVEEGAVLPGGGATEAELASVLRTYASGVEGREQLAVEAFAAALEVVPRTLAESAGRDPIDSLVELRRLHHGGERTVGLDVADGTFDDMAARGVLEPLAVKQQALESATEAASILLRVDDVIAVAARDDGEEHDHDHEHGPHGLQSTGGYPWMVGHS